MLKRTIASILLVSLNCYAFDLKKCREGITRTNLEYSGLLSPFTTSGQTTSSTGECSMLGLKEKRREFIVVNLTQIKNQAARGGGEELSVLAKLYGCTEFPSSAEFSKICRVDYTSIFISDHSEAIDVALEKKVQGLCNDDEPGVFVPLRKLTPHTTTSRKFG